MVSDGLDEAQVRFVFAESWPLTTGLIRGRGVAASAHSSVARASRPWRSMGKPALSEANGMPMPPRYFSTR